MNRSYPIEAGRPVDVWIPGRTHTAVVVVNTGDVVVLVDDTPPPGSAPLELAPGESIPWDANRALSLAVPDWSDPGEVLVTENQGESSGARAIARAIIAQGLAVDVAQAISLAGVPAIDRPVVLLPTQSATITRGTLWLSGAVDVGAYATAVVQLSVRGVGTTTPEQVTAELRWLTEDGVTTIATDRVVLWLDPGGGTQTWCLQAPAWGARLQLAVLVPATLTTTSVVLGASVIGSFRDRGIGRSVVTAPGAWGGTVTSTSRPMISPAVRVWSRIIPTGAVWRDSISPAWPGVKLTLNVQTITPLSSDLSMQVWAVNDAQVVDTIASWTMGAGAKRWTWALDTPPDTAVGFYLVNTGGAASSQVDVEAIWSQAPVSLPGVLL